MGESSKECGRACLKSCKPNNITLITYTRHRWRSKIETRNINEQEQHDAFIENQSENVSEKGEAEDVQVSGGSLISAFAPTVQVSGGNLISAFAPTLQVSGGSLISALDPTSVFGSTSRMPKTGSYVKLSDVPAPATPDIVARYGKASAMDPKKRTCCRSLNLDTRNLKRKAAEADKDYEILTPTGCIRERDEEERDGLVRQINLFMSRMNQIQGVRTFSEWKGSVMDSIVGAYLAQNVKDELSSSAFMSLAAKFPRDAAGAACRKSVQKGKSGKKDRCSRMRTNTKHDPALLNVLKDCHSKHRSEKRMSQTSDAVDWDSVRMATVSDIAKAIQKRGMSNNLAERIKDCLEQLVKNFESTDMEWIRDVPPLKAKEYLLSIYGLGLKSVECIRLLTLRHKAFPIDRNAGRVAVRLGWFPLNELPEGVEFHLLKVYRKVNSIQMYLWPHLSHLEWSILYELHCQLITFGKVFCREKNPNCCECPMRAECRHFASIQASADVKSRGLAEMDIEDYGLVRPRTRYRTSNMASIRVVKKKKKKKRKINVNVTSSRTEHQVYVLPGGHHLLAELESIEHGDACPYLLAVWTPESLGKDGCIHEEDAVYGTLLIPARTATGGTFPLNGTFFQTNEVFADHESSEVPVRISRASLTNLSSATLYCGSSVSSICKGMTCGEVQKCYNTGFACLRGLNLKTREPIPLPPRFHNRAGKPKKRDDMHKLDLER
uniref:DEMETER-like DNA glycosylase n=1 Tax=Salvia miltiorrhiza TaxID=226208 RepID=A0A2S0NIY3_SALMI|nr:DEMETER-like DNA glycosylase [Salvia miltiorrhiza]